MQFPRFLLVGLIATSVLAACNDDDNPTETGAINIHFKALYDGDPLVTFQTKPFITGQRIDFITLTALISDISLYKSSSEELLDDVELVNMGFDNLPAAETGYTVQYTGIPVGSYNGIRFGVGVPADVNQKKPADFPSSNPLSNTGYYWEAWDSFIFSKTEGHLDTLGSGPLDLNFAFHTGSDELYRSLEGQIPVTIQSGVTEELTIYIDYLDLLNGVDIKAKPQNHNPGDSLQIGRIVTNLQTSITLSH